MDDIGFGEHIAAFVITFFDLICLISAFFFLYRGAKKFYLLLLSVLLNIISVIFFGRYGMGNHISIDMNSINFELWPFVNLILLVIFSVNYTTAKEKDDYLKIKGGRLLKWIFRLIVLAYTPWLFLAIWFFLDASV